MKSKAKKKKFIADLNPSIEEIEIMKDVLTKILGHPLKGNSDCTDVPRGKRSEKDNSFVKNE